MSRAITDTSGQPLLYVNLHLSENSESVVIVARIPCAAGLYLAATESASARVMARRTGSGDAFADLATDPISLAAWDGSSIDFDFKVEALSVSSGLVRLALPARVTARP